MQGKKDGGDLAKIESRPKWVRKKPKKGPVVKTLYKLIIVKYMYFFKDKF